MTTANPKKPKRGRPENPKYLEDTRIVCRVTLGIPSVWKSPNFPNRYQSVMVQLEPSGAKSQTVRYQLGTNSFPGQAHERASMTQ